VDVKVEDAHGREFVGGAMAVVDEQLLSPDLEHAEDPVSLQVAEEVHLRLALLQLLGTREDRIRRQGLGLGGGAPDGVQDRRHAFTNKAATFNK